MVVDHSAARCSKRPGAVVAPKFIIKIVPLAAHLHSSFFSIQFVRREGENYLFFSFLFNELSMFIVVRLFPDVMTSIARQT